MRSCDPILSGAGLSGMALLRLRSQRYPDLWGMPRLMLS